MTDYNSFYTRFEPLGRVVFKVILEMICRKVYFFSEGWSGPRVSGKNGSYKLEWYSPTYDDTGDFIALDEKGTVTFWMDDEIREIKIPPLHSRGWSDKMMELGINERVALASVDFFKGIKQGASL